MVIPMQWDVGWLSIDPTLLVEGFAALGEDALICCEPGSTYTTDFPVVELSAREMRDPRAWANLGVELVIVFTWMTNYNDVMRAVKEAGAFVVSKGDTDGLLVARVHPAPTFQRLFFGPPYGTIGKARNVWFWAKKWAYLYRRELELIVSNIETADVTVVEIEAARPNLRRVLAYAGREDLMGKVACVENPVPESFGIGDGPRARIVVSVGRWDDPQKNARLLSQTLQECGRRDGSTRFVLAGRAGDSVPVGAAQVEALGHVSRDELGGVLSAARVCLISSRWEGSHISGHEALASGCTIVGTPIPVVRAMVGDGAWGTVAAGDNPGDLARALASEMRRWDEGERDPAAIAAHWHGKLRPRAIAQRYLALTTTAETADR